MLTEDAQYSTPLAVIKAMLCVEDGYTKGGCVIDCLSLLQLNSL